MIETRNQRAAWLKILSLPVNRRENRKSSIRIKKYLFFNFLSTRHLLPCFANISRVNFRNLLLIYSSKHNVIDLSIAPLSCLSWHISSPEFILSYNWYIVNKNRIGNRNYRQCGKTYLVLINTRNRPLCWNRAF